MPICFCVGEVLLMGIHLAWCTEPLISFSFIQHGTQGSICLFLRQSPIQANATLNTPTALYKCYCYINFVSLLLSFHFKHWISVGYRFLTPMLNLLILIARYSRNLLVGWHWSITPFYIETKIQNFVIVWWFSY